MTRDDTRRTVDDLRTLHCALEPGLRDVYVEGRTDQRLFAWYFRETGIPVSAVYAIDDRATIDSALVLSTGMEVGARGRVIGLASEAANWESDGCGVTCIIDADRDCLAPGAAYPSLLRTDFASIEGYLFQPAPLQRLLGLGLGVQTSSEDVIRWTLPALNELFVVRVALHLHGPGVPLVAKFMNCVSRRNDVWTVDAAELVTRSMGARGASARREVVLSQLEQIRLRLPADRSRAFRGHDVAPLLSATLGLGNELARPETLERIWLPCVRIEDLEPHPLFEQLRARLMS